MGNQKWKAAERRKRQRQQLIGGVIFIVLLAGGTAIYLAMTGDRAPNGPNEAEEFAGGPATLIYADFAGERDLHRLDLSSKENTVVREFPLVGETKAAPGSELFTIEVVEEDDSGELKPTIYLFDPNEDSAERLGIGVEPLWSPDGALLAWAEPTDPAECGEERCRGDLSVVITDPASGENETLVEAGPYTVVDWAGDYLIVQNDVTATTPILQTVSPDGEIRDLPLRPIDYWGASPDGAYIVESGESGVSRFLEMEDGQITSQGEDIAVPEGTKLGAGEWSHDSSTIAAFALGDDGLEFVHFTPTDPEPQTLAGGGDASTGGTFWSPDNDRVVFQRFNGEELEAVHCPIGDPDACEVLLTWTSGISLLRVE